MRRNSVFDMSFCLLQAPVSHAASVGGISISGASVPVGMGGGPGGQKHGGNAYSDNADGYFKRPRVEAYANALTSDIDSYRKQHEVTALVSST